MDTGICHDETFAHVSLHPTEQEARKMQGCLKQIPQRSWRCCRPSGMASRRLSSNEGGAGKAGAPFTVPQGNMGGTIRVKSPGGMGRTVRVKSVERAGRGKPHPAIAAMAAAEAAKAATAAASPADTATTAAAVDGQPHVAASATSVAAADAAKAAAVDGQPLTASPWKPSKDTLRPEDDEGHSFTVDTRGLFERLRRRDIKVPQTPLGTLLDKGIRKIGPISLADYMDMCMTHPEHGFYMRKEAAKIGKAGDFITAPEISQMFGELLGVWVVATWEKLGMPSGVRIVEVGPGKGTLMKDMLRTARSFQPFIEAVKGVELVENSAALRGVQAETLASTTTDAPGVPVPVSWHDKIRDVPDDGPLLLVAQELLDALPVHQFEYTKDGWRERMVDVDDDPGTVLRFRMTLSDGPTRAVQMMMQHPAYKDVWGAEKARVRIGLGLEACPLGMVMVREVAERVAATGGAALFVDYGEEHAQPDSIRGLRQHQWVHHLDAPGEVDLSADVDFGVLNRVVEGVEGARAFGPMPQGLFLSAMGIEARLQHLIDLDSTTDEQATSLFESYRRLVDPESMGRKYKAWALVSNKHQGPATGF